MTMNRHIEWRRLEPIPSEVQHQVCVRCSRALGKGRACLIGSTPQKAGEAAEPDAPAEYRHEHCPPP